MEKNNIIGKSIKRIESKEKVTATIRYANDIGMVGMMQGVLVTSSYAHANIKSIKTEDALNIPGVRAVVTGKDFKVLTGSALSDRYPVALDKVRYNGEVVAIVVGDDYLSAKKGADLVKVSYEALPVVNSATEALKKNTIIIHKELGKYKQGEKVYPVPGTNIASLIKIRKGDVENSFKDSDVVIEGTFITPPSNHVFMETHCSICRINPSGSIFITSTSQSPFIVKKLISQYFNVDMGMVNVKVPMIGGAYGGKAMVQTEILAVLASRAVNGRAVKIVYTRENDMTTAPNHMGMEANVKIGAKKDGKICGAKIELIYDNGAYADRGPSITTAGAVGASGPYKIDNFYCDSYCMYTNHPYCTAFRSYGYIESNFAIERAMDILAKKLDMDPLELRLKNAIMPGDSSPTQDILNSSTLGNVPKCIEKLKKIMRDNNFTYYLKTENKIISTGVGCFWKASNSPTNAGAGAVLTFNYDGSININAAAVDLGQGIKTCLCQMLAEKLQMNIDRIYINLEVDTKTTPEHWKTVGSRTTLLVGRAVLAAGEDLIKKLKAQTALVFKCDIDELDVSNEKVFLKNNPIKFVTFKEIAYGYLLPNGNSIGSQIIGSGSYEFNDLTYLNKENGEGKSTPEWTVGAAAVEIEIDTLNYEYKLKKAATVIDLGKILNYEGAKTQVTGGMNMGLSFASRENIIFSDNGIIKNNNLRFYRIMHFAENPEYFVDFVETPSDEGPFGSRGMGEHGIVSMPAALANAFSNAFSKEFNTLPLNPELIWRIVKGEK